MSWSSLKLRLAVAAIAGGALAAPAANAAEYYVVPAGSLTAGADSNIDLDPTGGSWQQGYIADASALFGIATQSTNTTIRPAVDYRNYPGDGQDNRLEANLDLNSSYRGQRDRGSIYFGFERRDEFTSELNSALYNDNAPTSPTSPETGRTLIGATRTSFLVLPEYDYSWTERFSTGASATYQQFLYQPNNTFNLVDFRYSQLKVFGRWDVTQRNDVTFGVYGSRYQATKYDSTANAGGVSLSLDTSWTPLFSTSVTGVVQHTKIDSQIPSPLTTSDNPWGLQVNATYKAEANQLRLDGGRLITPSGGGGIYVNDRLQVQYSRQMTQRLLLTGAAIVTRNRGLTSNVSGNDRTYERVLADVKYMLTRTLYIQGGYFYMRQKYEADPGAADDNRIYLRFGYQGLERQW